MTNPANAPKPPAQAGTIRAAGEDARTFDEAVLDELAAMLAAVPIGHAPAAEPAASPAPRAGADEPRDEATLTLVQMLSALQRDLEPLCSSAGARGPEDAGRPRSPGEDEWGFFDPKQCGISALLARLEQIAERHNSLRSRR